MELQDGQCKMTKFYKHSLYSNTTTENSLRGYYNPISLPRDEVTDIEYIVEAKYNNKPGLLAYDLYGDARLNWVFSVYNRDKIIDPIWDLKAGMTIIIPNRERLLNLLG